MSKFNRQVPPVEYLAACSEVSLQSFALERMARAADLRKQISEMQGDLVDALAEAELASWLLRYRRTLQTSPQLKKPIARVGARMGGRRETA